QPNEAQASQQTDQAPEALAIQAKKPDDIVSPQAITDRPDEPAAPAPVDDAAAPAPHPDLSQTIAADLQPKMPAAPTAPIAHPVAPEPPAPPVPPDPPFPATNHSQLAID